MRRTVRGAVSRRATELRVTAAQRYRDALAEDAPEVARYLLAAAALDRVATLRRAVAGAPSADVAGAARAAARRLRRPDTLLLVHAAVSATGELSLVLSGPSPQPAERIGVRLRGPGGEPDVSLSTLAVRTPTSLRVVADLPPEHFRSESTLWRVAVTDGARELPVVVASRAAITARWAGAQWPPELGLDAERRLTVGGRAPTHEGVEHRVSLGLTSLVVRWPDGPPELRLTSRADRGSLVVAGHAGADGRNQATVDLLALAGRPADVWDAAVRGGGDSWRPLRLAPGQPAVDDVLALRVDGRRVGLQVGYERRGQFAIAVDRPAGAPR